MLLFTSTFLFLLNGLCAYQQKLTCPYDRRYEGLPRVWCKEDSEECCTGIAFSRDSQSLDEGNLEIQQGEASFTVTVMRLFNGSGVYWCGVLFSENQTIVKLAADYFYETPPFHVWNILRWVVSSMLPLASILAYIYSSRKHKKVEKEEGVYMDIPMTTRRHREEQPGDTTVSEQ